MIKSFFIEAKDLAMVVIYFDWLVFVLTFDFEQTDIASAWGGFVIVIILSLLFNIVLGFIKLEWLELCTYHIVRAGSILVSMLLLSLFISLIAVAFSYIIRLIFFRRG